METRKLGFSEAPDSVTYIFVGESSDAASAWYFWDHSENAPVSIKDNCLSGYLRDVSVTKHDTKAGISYKLNLKIQADKMYCIRSGVTTNFSRGILLAMAEAISSPPGSSLLTNGAYISIAVKKGDEGKVVFGNFFLDNVRIYPEWDADCQLFPVINKIQEAIGTYIQTKETLDKKEIEQPVVKERVNEQKNTIKTQNKRKVEVIVEDDESSDDFVF